MDRYEKIGVVGKNGEIETSISVENLKTVKRYEILVTANVKTAKKLFYDSELDDSIRKIKQIYYKKIELKTTSNKKFKNELKAIAVELKKALEDYNYKYIKKQVNYYNRIIKERNKPIRHRRKIRYYSEKFNRMAKMDKLDLLCSRGKFKTAVERFGEKAVKQWCKEAFNTLSGRTLAYIDSSDIENAILFMEVHHEKFWGLFNDGFWFVGIDNNSEKWSYYLPPNSDTIYSSNFDIFDAMERVFPLPSRSLENKIRGIDYIRQGDVLLLRRDEYCINMDKVKDLAERNIIDLYKTCEYDVNDSHYIKSKTEFLVIEHKNINRIILEFRDTAKLIHTHKPQHATETIKAGIYELYTVIEMLGD